MKKWSLIPLIKKTMETVLRLMETVESYNTKLWIMSEFYHTTNSAEMLTLNSSLIVDLLAPVLQAIQSETDVHVYITNISPEDEQRFITPLLNLYNNRAVAIHIHHFDSVDAFQQQFQKDALLPPGFLITANPEFLMADQELQALLQFYGRQLQTHRLFNVTRVLLDPPIRARLKYIWEPQSTKTLQNSFVKSFSSQIEHVSTPPLQIVHSRSFG